MDTTMMLLLCLTLVTYTAQEDFDLSKVTDYQLKLVACTGCDKVPAFTKVADAYMDCLAKNGFQIKFPSDLEQCKKEVKTGFKAFLADKEEQKKYKTCHDMFAKSGASVAAEAEKVCP